VSVEALATPLSGAGVLLSLAAGFAWTIRRQNTSELRLSTRIDVLDARLSTRIDTVEHEVVEVRITVARLEGPRPRLITGH
jgi:hypothetical protein